MVMNNTMKKMGLSMSVLMGLTMSFILSLVGTLGSGHFTVPGWLRSFVISLVISLVIGFVIPMKQVSDAACSKAGISVNTTKGRLFSALISDLIYTPLITVIMVSVAITGAGKAIDAQIAEKNAQLEETGTAISQIEAQVGELTAKLETCAPEETEELNAQIGELKGQLGELNGKSEGLKGAIDGMTAAKPPFVPVLVKSLILTLIVGYIAIFILQPIYLKILLKKYGLSE